MNSSSSASTQGAAPDRSSRLLQRRLAREVVLRGAYICEMRSCSPEEAFSDPMLYLDDADETYVGRLLPIVCQNNDRLDELIRAKVEKWEFHRVALIDKLILRIALAELLYMPDVPPKVSINEAIELSKLYSTDNSGRFINGILDSFLADMKSGALIAPPRR